MRYPYEYAVKSFYDGGYFFACRNEMQASADLDEASECPQHITPKIVCLDESEKSSESVVPTTENRNAIEADTVKKISRCPPQFRLVGSHLCLVNFHPRRCVSVIG